MHRYIPFCNVSFTNFALNHFVDCHELCEVSVSLFTVQLHCACTHVRTFFLLLKRPAVEPMRVGPVLPGVVRNSGSTQEQLGHRQIRFQNHMKTQILGKGTETKRQEWNEQWAGGLFGVIEEKAVGRHLK